MPDITPDEPAYIPDKLVYIPDDVLFVLPERCPAAEAVSAVSRVRAVVIQNSTKDKHVFTDVFFIMLSVFSYQSSAISFQPSDSRPQIFDFRPQISELRTQNSDFKFQISDPIFQIQDFSYPGFCAQLSFVASVFQHVRCGLFTTIKSYFCRRNCTTSFCFKDDESWPSTSAVEPWLTLRQVISMTLSALMTIGLKLSVCGHSGVITRASIEPAIIGPPAERL